MQISQHKKQILVYCDDKVEIFYKDINNSLSPIWVDSKAFIFDYNRLSVVQDLGFTCSPTYFESLLVSPITDANLELEEQVIAISFDNDVKFGEYEILETSVCSQVSSNVLLCNVSGNLLRLLQTIEKSKFGIIREVFLVEKEMLLGGYNNFHYRHVLNYTFAQSEQERLGGEDRVKRVQSVLSSVRGHIIHTTSPTNFYSILTDGYIRRGIKKDAIGKCQKEGCLSLNDLRRTSDDKLLDFDNWFSQLISPSGVEEELIVSVTMIINRQKLDQSKLEYLQNRPPEAFRGPPHGIYIAESEVCYCDDIPIESVESVLLIATQTDPIKQKLCSLEEVKAELDKFIIEITETDESEIKF